MKRAIEVPLQGRQGGAKVPRTVDDSDLEIDSDSDAKMTTFDASKSFTSVLKDVRGGPISTGGRCRPAGLPGLSLGGDTVPLPLVKSVWKHILETTSCASLAPFGKGREKLVDADVRHTWQINPEDVKLDFDSGWAAAMDDVVTRSTKELGCWKHDVVAVPYKVLVYEEGSHFAAHVDSEKEDRMFGTLIVQLPSKFEGGGLVVRHDGKETVHDFGAASGRAAHVAHFAAHFADVEHEFRPVTSGFRVAMVYSLCWHDPGAIAGELKLPETRAAAEAAASRAWGPSWFLSDDSVSMSATLQKQAHKRAGTPKTKKKKKKMKAAPEAIEAPRSFTGDATVAARVKTAAALWAAAIGQGEATAPVLAVGLDHTYTQDSVADRGFEALKGWDAALAQVVSAPDSGLDVFLVRLRGSMDVTCSADYMTFSSENTLWLPGPGSPSLCLGEDLRFCSGWVEANTVSVRGQGLWSLVDQASDITYGNEPCLITRTYERYALVLWPRAVRRGILASCPTGLVDLFLLDSAQARAQGQGSDALAPELPPKPAPAPRKAASADPRLPLANESDAGSALVWTPGQAAGQRATFYDHTIDAWYELGDAAPGAFEALEDPEGVSMADVCAAVAKLNVRMPNRCRNPSLRDADRAERHSWVLRALFELALFDYAQQHRDRDGDGDGDGDGGDDDDDDDDVAPLMAAVVSKVVGEPACKWLTEDRYLEEADPLLHPASPGLRAEHLGALARLLGGPAARAKMLERALKQFPDDKRLRKSLWAALVARRSHNTVREVARLVLDEGIPMPAQSAPDFWMRALEFATKVTDASAARRIVQHVALQHGSDCIDESKTIGAVILVDILGDEARLNSTVQRVVEPKKGWAIPFRSKDHIVKQAVRRCTPELAAQIAIAYCDTEEGKYKADSKEWAESAGDAATSAMHDVFKATIEARANKSSPPAQP